MKLTIKNCVGDHYVFKKYLYRKKLTFHECKCTKKGHLFIYWKSCNVDILDVCNNTFQNQNSVNGYTKVFILFCYETRAPIGQDGFYRFSI